MGPDFLAVGRAGDGGLRRPAGCQPRRIHADGNGSHHHADGNDGAANANCGPDADFYAAAYSNSDPDSGPDHRSNANPAAYCDANANSNRNASTDAAARCAAGSHRDGHLHR